MTRLLRANYTHSTFYRRIDRVVGSFEHRQPPSTYVDSDLRWRKACLPGLLIYWRNYLVRHEETLFLASMISHTRNDRNTNIVEKLYINCNIEKRIYYYGRENERKIWENPFSQETGNKSKIYETISVNKTVIYSEYIFRSDSFYFHPSE